MLITPLLPLCVGGDVPGTVYTTYNPLKTRSFDYCRCLT